MFYVSLSLFKLFKNEICILYLLQCTPDPPPPSQSSDNALVQSVGVGLSHLTLSAAREDDPWRENRTTQSNVSLRIISIYVAT